MRLRSLMASTDKSTTSGGLVEATTVARCDPMRLASARPQSQPRERILDEQHGLGRLTEQPLR
jgi:hypothetical protein